MSKLLQQLEAHLRIPAPTVDQAGAQPVPACQVPHPRARHGTKLVHAVSHGHRDSSSQTSVQSRYDPRKTRESHQSRGGSAFASRPKPSSTRCGCVAASIGGVKDNQPTLHQRVQDVSATTAPLGSAHSHDKGHNRDERRTVAVLEPANTLAGTDWHPCIAAIIRAERDVHTRNAKTGLLRHSAETAFCVANTPVTAARAADAIRAHWKVENTSHHSRDVALGEDRSRIRTNPSVFARLRSFAFSILKANRTDTLSQDRYRAGLARVGKLLKMLAAPQR